MTNIKQLALLGGTPLIKEPLPRWPEINSQDVKAVLNTLKNEELSAYEVIDGPLFNFENELKERFNTKYALLVGSGSAALQSAIFALSLGPGDEVIVPSITFPGTASIVLHSGASLRFIDVDADTGNPNLDNIISAITNKTRAVILAHAWGIPADVTNIVPYLKSRNIAVIEDAARAFGSRCNGREVGTFGDIGCFSFHELKAVPAGEGGLFLTNNRLFYERAIVLGHYFRSKEIYNLSLPELIVYKDSSLGLNLKIHPLAASLARSQLSRLDNRLEDMAENYLQLSTKINKMPYARMQKIPSWADRVSYYGFNFHWNFSGDKNIPSAASIAAAFSAEGLKVSMIGSPPLFQLPLFKTENVKKVLPGAVCGSTDDVSFPGAIAHAYSLLRFPVLHSRQEKWVNRYVLTFEKILNNLESLIQWEKNSKEK